MCVSGVSMILVGACGPEEILPFHLIAAVGAFGGSAVAQIIYNGVLYHEENPTTTSKVNRL
jgi:hypothetical protein